MTCVVCRSEPSAEGLLCESCRYEIASSPGLVPQQILATCAQPTGDVLIDRWGRPHPLEARMLIGRSSDGAQLMLLEASVSRHHAHLSHDADGWRLRDLASVNGTFVNDGPIETAVVTHGDRIAFGAVRFYFVPGFGEIRPPALDAAAITTVRTTPMSFGDHGELDGDGLVTEEPTDAGLPIVRLNVAEAVGGSGGVLEVGDVSILLSTNQTRLVALLVNRMVIEAEQPAYVRGFVRSSELLGALAWDSPQPDDNHVKQLVRRTRRQLLRAGLGDVIEARQRFGYRLRLIPQD